MPFYKLKNPLCYTRQGLATQPGDDAKQKALELVTESPDFSQSPLKFPGDLIYFLPLIFHFIHLKPIPPKIMPKLAKVVLELN